MTRLVSMKERIRKKFREIVFSVKKRIPIPVRNGLRFIYYLLFPGKKNKVTWGEDQSESRNKKIYENVIQKFHNLFSPREIKNDDISSMRHLLSKEYKGIIIYPPTVNWRFPLFQRPHQIFRVLAEKGYLCFFCVPHPEQDGVEGLKEVQENLFLCGNVPLLHTFLKDEEVIIWATWTPHKVFYEHFPNGRLLYDFIDELNVFQGFSVSMEEDHRTLLRIADLVLTTAASLWEKVKETREDALLIPNGAYLHDFEIKSPPSPPNDLTNILENGRPIIGYYGALSEWFDYELVNDVARTCKGYNIVLIGPNYDGSIRRLLRTDNLFWLGSKEYQDLKNYLYFFGVAIIPFKVNRITHSTSPIKLFEYMAGGKPIVVTDLKECRKYRSVYIAKDKEDFISKIAIAWERRNDPEYIRLLKHEAEENSWHSRVEIVIGQLSKKLKSEDG